MDEAKIENTTNEAGFGKLKSEPHVLDLFNPRMSVSAVSNSSNEPNLLPGVYSPGHVKRLREQYETNSPSASPRGTDKSAHMSPGSEKDADETAFHGKSSTNSTTLCCPLDSQNKIRNLSNNGSAKTFSSIIRNKFPELSSLNSSEKEILDNADVCNPPIERPVTAPAGSRGTYGAGNKLEGKSASSSQVPSKAENSENRHLSSASRFSCLPFPITKSSLGKSLLEEKQNLVDGKLSSPAFFRSQSALSVPSFMKRRSSISEVTREIISPMQNEYPMLAPYLRRNPVEDSTLSLFIPNEDPAEQILRLCGQRKPIPMDVIFQGLTNLQKLGEGVFGEVYQGQLLNCEEIIVNRVYKVVAIEGDELVNGEKQKKFAEILPEIFVSKQVSKLHEGCNGARTDGFVKMYNVRIATGMYPQSLITAWAAWDELNESDNESPSFLNSQLYVLFEYEHGGHDVEPFGFTSARQSLSLVLQIAHILAVGESAFEMEHRDLHWGNVLVNSTSDAELKYKLNGETLKLPSNGVKGCIIDFTLARILGDKGQPVYLDLGDDEEQFLGTGDHQFDIYRMMKDFNRNEWGTFYPKSNVYWVHYLAEKLIRRGRYDTPNSGEHAFFLNLLHCLHRKVMRFSSCVEFVRSSVCEQLKHLSISTYPVPPDVVSNEDCRNNTTADSLKTS